MLDDHEQRALEDLERCYVMEARGSARPGRPGRVTRRSARRPDRPPGFRVVTALACVSLALVLVGVPTAGCAVALATAIGWLFWRLWVHRTDDVSAWSVRGRDGHDGSDRRPGESIRQYLAWLAEAE